MEEIKAPKKERKFLKAVGNIAKVLANELVMGIARKFIGKAIDKVGNKRQGLVIAFALVAGISYASIDSIPYPITGNKQRLGWQTSGNGLVYRGRSNDTITKPSSYVDKNVKAYLLLDSVRGTIFVWRQTYWDSILVGGGGGSFDTTTLNLVNRFAQKVNISDTANMLLPYFKDTDTSILNLQNRFNLKLNISDTAAMLLPYATKLYVDTADRFYARQDFINAQTSTLTWTQSDTLVPLGVSKIMVYRNGQILLTSQYTIPNKTTIIIAESSFKVGENYTVIFPKGGGGSGGNGGGGGGGGGGVTSISAGTGITVSPNPITTTGVVSADLSVLMELTDTSLLNLTSRFASKLNTTDTASLSNRINAKGNGTVTSVATGYGLTGGTITTTGTLLLDSSVVFSIIRDSIVDVAIGNDTIKILKQEYAPATTSVLTWTITPKFPIQLKQYILVFRNGQLLINDQYNLTDTNKITIVSNSFKLGANYTVVTVSGIGSVGTGVFSNPIYPDAGIALSTGTTWASSIPNNSTNWNTAFTDRLKWDGGSTGLVPSTGRTSLGGTTIGQSMFTLTNPSTISFPRFNGDNTITARSAANFRSDIGAGSVTTVTVAAGTPLSIQNNTTTPEISMAAATGSVNGYLTSTDWTTFNNKQAALGFTPANSTITINTTSPLQGGGNLTANRTFSILSASDSQSGIVNTTAQLFSGSKVFKHRLTADSLFYLNNTSPIPTAILGIDLTGGVNSVGKFTLGNGLSITSSSLLADTNLLVTRFDTASMLANYLRSGVAASTYQTKLTNPVTGTGTNNYIPKFTTTGSTIGNSTLIDNGTTISTASILSTTNYAALDAGNNTHRLTNTLSGNQTWTPSAGFLTSYFNNNVSGGWYYNTLVDNSGFPILSILSTSNDRKKSGITLNSQGTANGTYSPAITFSSLSNSTAYYSAYAAIIGKKTGVGGPTGSDGNWNTGHIEFYGTTQATDVNGGVMLNSPSMTLGVGVGIGYDAPPTIKGRLTVLEKLGINQPTPAFALDVNGTLGVTGATTLGSTLAVTGNITEGGNNVLTNLDTASLSSRIDSKYNSSGGTISGAVTLSTTSATPTTLLGKDGSNVVGKVTDINQSGVMKVGSTTATTNNVGGINVAHGLSYTPSKVIATIAQLNSYVIVVRGITSTDLEFTVYDSTTGVGLNSVSVGFFWIAFK